MQINQNNWKPIGSGSPSRANLGISPSSLNIVDLKTNLRASAPNYQPRMNPINNNGLVSKYQSNYSLQTQHRRKTPDLVARDLSQSLYFGTEKAALRAYAPEVIGQHGEFWVGKKTIGNKNGGSETRMKNRVYRSSAV